MAKRKRTAKGGASEPKSAVTLSCPAWDHGAGGKANRANLVTEERGDMDPNTGKIINPNGVTGVRRLSVIDQYAAEGMIGEPHATIANRLVAMSEGHKASDPLAAILIDRRMGSSDPQAAAFDSRREFHRAWRAVPQDCAAVLEVTIMSGRHVDDVFGAKTSERLDAYAKLRVGLAMAGEAIE